MKLQSIEFRFANPAHEEAHNKFLAAFIENKYNDHERIAQELFENGVPSLASLSSETICALIYRKANNVFLNSWQRREKDFGNWAPPFLFFDKNTGILSFGLGFYKMESSNFLEYANTAVSKLLAIPGVLGCELVSGRTVFKITVKEQQKKGLIG